MKKLILTLLQRRAKKVVRKFHPIVVAVTGSVGKTSTRQAIAAALADSYVLRTPEKNYNNEFGLPFAILGEKSPGKNAWEWWKLFKRARHIREYPAMLVLEYGADRPGDIAALCRVAQPNVSVITAVSPVHVSNYPNFNSLASEKESLGTATPADGLVVLNADDVTVLAMKDRLPAEVVTYGLHALANVTATDVRVEALHAASFGVDETYIVTRANVTAFGEEAELVLKNCLGASSVSTCLAAIAVANHFGVSVAETVDRLNKAVRPVPGRLNPVAGIRGSLILDDTYNAAPASVHAALEALHLLVPGEVKDRRIAVLGKMAELGSMSEDEHAKVGAHVAEVADLFLAVGVEMRAAVESATAAGMDREHIEWFATPAEAGRYLDREVRAGDVVLVKGSQSARMEKAVIDIIAEPLRAPELLVRQEAYWQTH